MYFCHLEEFPNSCPAHEAGRVQMEPAAYGGHSLTNADLEGTESANKVWGVTSLCL